MMGRSPVTLKEEKALIKKGPWTPEEDEKLVEYIQKHGHGSWRALPKLAGLKRCGKSCRLRWTNYLRPDIKRGKFSDEEEQIIINIHALLGNKWSMIAGHLPGRTDNEIKNYWNTYLKKKLVKMGIDPLTHRPVTIDHHHLMDMLNSNLNHSFLNIINPIIRDNWDDEYYYNVVMNNMNSHAPLDQIMHSISQIIVNKMQLQAAIVHKMILIGHLLQQLPRSSSVTNPSPTIIDNIVEEITSNFLGPYSFSPSSLSTMESKQLNYHEQCLTSSGMSNWNNFNRSYSRSNSELEGLLPTGLGSSAHQNQNPGPRNDDRCLNFPTPNLEAAGDARGCKEMIMMSKQQDPQQLISSGSGSSSSSLQSYAILNDHDHQLQPHYDHDDHVDTFVWPAGRGITTNYNYVDQKECSNSY